MSDIRAVLRQRIADALTTPVPTLTRRDVRLPEVAGKAHAVIGMRRSGKSTFLWQCLAERLAAGTPREALLYLNLEDERLNGMTAADLGGVIEEWFRQIPGIRDRTRATLFLDEVQLIPGWEAAVRRILDQERIDLFLSGSSAHLLSSEIATSMRGRALPTTVYPFSFRESLRHAGMEPAKAWDRLPKATRSDLDARLRRYLSAGGFPEAQGVPDRDRAALLRSYVDVAVLRDVIERHSVSHPVALRWLQRHLLSTAGSLFSVQKCWDTMRSQGLAVGKDSVHAWLAHLEDCFLVRTLCVATSSERRRMVNPRKSYPIDPGLIQVWSRSPEAQTGHALENAILIELLRRGQEVDYVKTDEGQEIDFLARDHAGRETLIQVACDTADAGTREREVRALVAESRRRPRADPLLITMDILPPQVPAGIRWMAAGEWLLQPAD
jgi:predicted AAA+ superfamily ATPase